jgi:Zn-finger nucleic acid-binding protein
MESGGGMEVHEILIELKYCERCGGLWLRPQGADTVYCGGCRKLLEARQNLAMIPAFRSRRRERRSQGTGRQKRGEDVRRSREIDRLEGVATIEVRA